MPTLRCWGFFIVLVFSGVVTPVQAQNKVDLLQAEGSPADVAQKLDQKLRDILGKQSQIKLLDNPLSPMMARLTLGCIDDTPDCMQRLAQMRNAESLYHLRVLPAGGPMVLATLRQIDGKTGQATKAVSYTFAATQIDVAAASLAKQVGLAPGIVIPTAPVETRPEPRPPVVTRPEPRPPVVTRPEPRPPVVTPPPVETRPEPRPPVVTPPPVETRPEPRPPVVTPPPVETRPEPRPPVVVQPDPRVPVIRPDPRAIPTPIRPVVEIRQPPIKRDTRVATNPSTITEKVAPPDSTPLWQKPMFWGWVSVGVAVAGTGVAISFGALAGAKQGEVNQKLKASQTGQALSYTKDIQPLEKQGQTNAVVSNVGTGIAIAGAVSATVFFVWALTRGSSAPAAQTPPSRASQAVPSSLQPTATFYQSP